MSVKEPIYHDCGTDCVVITSTTGLTDEVKLHYDPRYGLVYTQDQWDDLFGSIKETKFQETEKPEPLPCPLCGSKEIYTKSHSLWNINYISIRCRTCEVMGPEDISKEGAIEKWNLLERGKKRPFDRVIRKLYIEE